MTISDILYDICDFSLLIIIIHMLGDFLTYKDIKKYWLAGGSIIFLVFTLAASRSISVPIINFLVNTICVFILSLAFMGSIKKKILVSSVITIINAAGDIIAYMLITPGDEPETINLSFIGTVLIILICERIIKRIFKDKEKTEFMAYQGMILIIIPLCSLGIIYCSARNNYGKYFTFVIALCVLIINVTVFYLYRILEEDYLRKMRNIELEEQIKAYSNELNIIAESQNRVRSLQHDMNHHLIEIEGLYNRRKWEDIKNYLDNMKKSLNNMDEYVYSGHLEIDSLLNFLLRKAHDKLYKVDVKINIPEDIELNIFKFNIIVGNLVENAVRASEESEDKIFYMNLEANKGILFLTIKNSYKKIVKDGNSYISTKTDKNSHGIGLKNVERIIKETHGNIDISTDGDFFIVKVILYVDQLN